MAQANPAQWSKFLLIFNAKFKLPMETISQFWAAISATYVGLDRMAYTAKAWKDGNDTVSMSDYRMTQLAQIIWLSFFIFILALGLNTIFDVDLALEPLMISFGSSVLCYVAGNKAVRAFESLSVKNKALASEIIKDLDQKQLDTLKSFSESLREKKEFILKVNEDSEIVQSRFS